MVNLIRAMPYDKAIAVGRFLGLVGYFADPFHRKVAHIQMRQALGDAYYPGIVRKVFMNHGDILVDTIKYAYMSVEEISKRIEVVGREHLYDAIANGKGVMVVTGHIGNWEILTHMSRLLNIEFCVMADVRKDERLESLVDEIRSRSGATILPPKGKALMLIKELKKGHTVAIVADQRGKRSDGLFCDLFGLPAPTNPAPASLGVKSGALILTTYAVKVNGRYLVHFSEPREASSFGEGKEGIVGANADMTGQCDLEPATETDALNSGNQGDIQGFKMIEQRFPGMYSRFQVLTGGQESEQRSDISSSRKMLALPVNDDPFQSGRSGPFPERLQGDELRFMQQVVGGRAKR